MQARCGHMRPWRSGALGASLLLLSSCPRARAPLGERRPNEVVWNYRVEISSIDKLTVHATLASGSGNELSIEPRVAPFVHIEKSSVTLARTADGWSGDCREGCSIDYEIDLQKAAASIQDADEAWLAGGVVVAPGSSWLLRPTPEMSGDYRVEMRATGGVKFAIGLAPEGSLRAGDTHTFRAPTSPMDEDPYAAFGPLRLQRLPAPLESVQLAAAPDVKLSDADLARWIGAEVDAMRTLLGMPPATRMLVVLTQQASGPTRGKTLGDGGAAIFVRVGAEVDARTVLAEDWVVTHELVHTGFPRVERAHAWFAEGLATYVEPVVRARAGMIDEPSVWKDLLENLPSGVADTRAGLAGDGDHAHIYWGGALYWLAVDVAIRERTHGEKTIDDALREIAKACGNVGSHRAAEEVVAIGDRAVGGHEMSTWFTAFATTTRRPSIDELLTRLGVERSGSSIVLRDDAPLSSVRRAISGIRRKAGPE